MQKFATWIEGLTYLFIAHDLSMSGVKYSISNPFSGSVHWGNSRKLGPADEIYHHPIHILIQSAPNAAIPTRSEESVSVSIWITIPPRQNDGENEQMYEIKTRGICLCYKHEEAKTHKKKRSPKANSALHKKVVDSPDASFLF